MENKKPVIGQYILDTLTMGMYNNPLMVLREYIQNSADSIDVFANEKKTANCPAKIEVQIDLAAANISIYDTGAGIPQRLAYSTLHDLGRSSKNNSFNRGFRGIGRLGGLGYCNELVFSTKAVGERVVSVSKWDCGKLSRALADKGATQDITGLISEVSDFNHEAYSGPVGDHFFKVEMKGLHARRNPLLDIPLVSSYLSQTAPVPYNSECFSYSTEISEHLQEKVPGYNTYDIFVNGGKISKPYADLVAIGGHSTDTLRGIKYFDLKENGQLLAFGWIGETSLFGAISPQTNFDGIRLRSGNIAVGDKNLLGDFFRERRFNAYLLGEIHVVNPGLVLNSRRDDFEDNHFKDKFYEVFLQEIGIPHSSEIRAASNMRAKNNSIKRNDAILRTVKKIISEGYISKMQQAKIVDDLKGQFKIQNKQLLSQLTDPRGTLKEIMSAKHFLDLPNKNLKNVKNKEFLKKIFDVVYSKSSNKTEAETIIKGILRESLIN